MLHLTINMRVHLCGNPSTKTFSQWLLDVGDGKNGNPLTIPDSMLIESGSVAEVITGTREGTTVCLPRIHLTPLDDSQHAIRFTRRRFPFRLAFCVTINKSQGQTFDRVGVLLPGPVFSHGQACVAFSRCGNQNHIHILLQRGAWPDENTSNAMKNVV